MNAVFGRLTALRLRLNLSFLSLGIQELPRLLRTYCAGTWICPWLPTIGLRNFFHILAIYRKFSPADGFLWTSLWNSGGALGKNLEKTPLRGLLGIHFLISKRILNLSHLALIDLQLARIPYLTGYSPLLWQQGINCMLEKKKGNFRVDKLRAILFYEAEFNLINKFIGRESMYSAKRLRGVAWEQYGCRKEHSAVNQGLNKALTCDICLQQKQPFAICSNDAKSCFDHIVHSIASLALQRVGFPPEPLICVFTTIRHLEHRIRTVHGDSDIGFCGKLWAAPIHGIGQGNGAGPQIWALVSTPVLNMLQSEGFGALFWTALSGDKVSFVGYSFVDDTDLIIAHPDLTTSSQVHDKMQDSINAWEGGIRVTGGAIVPEKSCWYLLDFKWKQGRWPYSSLSESPGSLFVRDLSGGTPRLLRRLHHSEAERTLGVYIAPDGNMATQAKILRAKAEQWAELTRTGLIPRWLVWQSFRSSITRTLHYPLAATTLTQAQCTHIMAPVKKVALSGSGIACTFSNALA